MHTVNNLLFFFFSSLNLQLTFHFSRDPWSARGLTLRKVSEMRQHLLCECSEFVRPFDSLRRLREREREREAEPELLRLRDFRFLNIFIFQELVIRIYLLYIQSPNEKHEVKIENYH